MSGKAIGLLFDVTMGLVTGEAVIVHVHIAVQCILLLTQHSEGTQNDTRDNVTEQPEERDGNDVVEGLELECSRGLGNDTGNEEFHAAEH